MTSLPEIELAKELSMQRLFVAGFAAFALLIAAGCPKSPEGGKTDKTQNKGTTDASKTTTTTTDGAKNTGGNTTPADKANTNAADNKDQTFKITKILTDVSVTQGGANEAKIDITRSNNFTQSIKLDAQKVPEKVKVEFSPATVKAGDKAQSIMKVTAEKDAPVGVHTIYVQGTPDMGSVTGIDVDINVKKQ
jgi:hypothetical protein